MSPSPWGPYASPGARVPCAVVLHLRTFPSRSRPPACRTASSMPLSRSKFFTPTWRGVAPAEIDRRLQLEAPLFSRQGEQEIHHEVLREIQPRHLVVDVLARLRSTSKWTPFISKFMSASSGRMIRWPARPGTLRPSCGRARFPRGEDLDDLLVRQALPAGARPPCLLSAAMISRIISFTPSFENREPPEPEPAIELEKKCFKRIDAPFGLHVLRRGDAGHGGLVHADLRRDVLQGERPQVLRAPEEEIPLELHDGPADLQQCLVSLADRADEPAGILEVGATKGRVLGSFDFSRGDGISNRGLMPSTGIISSFRTMTNSPSRRSTCTSGTT